MNIPYMDLFGLCEYLDCNLLFIETEELDLESNNYFSYREDYFEYLSEWNN